LGSEIEGNDMIYKAYVKAVYETEDSFQDNIDKLIAGSGGVKSIHFLEKSGTCLSIVVDLEDDGSIIYPEHRVLEIYVK
jgi:hypothetical protein